MIDKQQARSKALAALENTSSSRYSFTNTGVSGLMTLLVATPASDDTEVM